MYHRWICLLLAWTILTSIAYGQSEPLVYIYDQAINQKKKINLSAVISGDYSEIRWDEDADGLVDQWIISKKNLTITQKFGKHSLEVISVLARREQYFLKLIYRQVNAELRLVRIEKIPHKSYFEESADDSVAELDSLKSGAAAKLATACPESPYKKVLSAENWHNFQCRMTQEAREEDLEKAIDKSCGKPLLTFEQRKELKEAVREIYGINFMAPVEHNKILTCLSTGPSRMLKDLYPIFLAKITSAIAMRKTPEIVCVLKPAVGCGTAEWISSSDTINVPITKPACASNMKSTFAAGLFHEKIHQTNPDLHESDIKKVVKGCLSGDQSILKELDENYTDLMGGGKYSSGTLSPAKIKHEAAAISQQISANIPVSVAAGSVLPMAGSGSIFNRAMTALSIGNRNIASVNPVEDLRISQGRTRHALSAFGFLGGVTPAQAAPLAVVDFDNLRATVTLPTISSSDSDISARGPASAKPVQAVKVSGGSDGRDSAKVPSLTAGSAKIGFNPSETSSSIDTKPSPPIITQLQKEISSIKDPAKQAQILEQKRKQLVAGKIHIYVTATKQSFGAEMAKAHLKYSLIDGILVPE